MAELAEQPGQEPFHLLADAKRGRFPMAGDVSNRDLVASYPISHDSWADQRILCDDEVGMLQRAAGGEGDTAY